MAETRTKNAHGSYNVQNMINVAPTRAVNALNNKSENLFKLDFVLNDFQR